MKQRLGHLLLAELLAFAAFVTGGLALLGGIATWSGESRHPTGLSWVLVAVFAAVSLAFTRSAFTRLVRVFAARRPATVPLEPVGAQQSRG